MHPKTALTWAGCAWAAVIVVDSVIFSAAVLVLAVVLGTLVCRDGRVVASTVMLSVPVSLSMALIHVPFGKNQVAPLITSDGAEVALGLAIRFCALMACVLAAVAATTIVDIAKWLQVSAAGHRLGFIVGSTLQFLPQGQRSLRSVREANFLFGRNQSVRATAIPLIFRLLSEGTQRGHALVSVGFDLPGRRTILRPVPDSIRQQVLRWCALATLLGVLLWKFL